MAFEPGAMGKVKGKVTIMDNARKDHSERSSSEETERANSQTFSDSSESGESPRAIRGDSFVIGS